MKIGELLKKAATAVFQADASRSIPARDARQIATTAYVEWHREWAERQRAYRASHVPGVRVPGPRQLGMSWPPPHNPNGITLQT